MTVEIVEAETPAQLAMVAALFRTYARAEPDELCFAEFERELAGLPGAYAPPAGRLLLALEGEAAAGCVGVCAGATAGEAEIKRLYVAPRWRGTGLGRGLAEAALEGARELGYRTVALETRAHMEAARALYRTLGFADVGRDGPVIRMGLDLAARLEDAR